ncbi:MAG: acyloxyacyl hydrolase [Pseudomonadota bacterium]
MFIHLKLTRSAFILGLGLLTIAQQGFAQDHPADHWDFGVEAGYLSKVRNNSPLDYAIIPTQLVWHTPAQFELWRGDSGARLAVRHRLAVVTELYVKGPEDVYFAFAGSPSFQLWSADQKTALIYEIGGGAGLINSKNVAGGQGQNFTLNWFTQLAVRHQFTKNFGVTAGPYFTHHSNLGMTKPNPGIDVLGVNFGFYWQL